MLPIHLARILDGRLAQEEDDAPGGLRGGDAGGAAALPDPLHQPRRPLQPDLGVHQAGIGGEGPHADCPPRRRFSSAVNSTLANLVCL